MKIIRQNGISQTCEHCKSEVLIEGPQDLFWDNDRLVFWLCPICDHRNPTVGISEGWCSAARQWDTDSRPPVPCKPTSHFHAKTCQDGHRWGGKEINDTYCIDCGVYRPVGKIY